MGGTAKSLSGGVDELNTMLGLIADNGIKGAEGGTALRNIILSLSAPTDIGGEVFTVETKTDEDGNKTKEYKINDIDAQIQKMQAYHENIKKLKEDGASAAMLAELNSLSGEDGAKMAEYVAGLSDAERAKVIELYRQKEQIADDLSADLYAKDAENMQNAFAAALTNLGINAYDSGAAAAEQFAMGFNGTISELIDISAIVTQQRAASSASSASAAANGNSDTNVNVDVTVTGGNLTLDGNAMGEYQLDYETQVNTQKENNYA